MGSLMWLTQFLSVLLFLLHVQDISSLPLFSNSSSTTEKILCHQDESIALIHFKNSFSIYSYAYVGGFPKTESWKEGTDCCMWKGVICDMKKGNIIGLNLQRSMLFGSFHYNSSIFFLSHLQYLDLSYNDFLGSHISSHFSQFFNLKYLNLSSSNFASQVPLEMSQLSKLVSLDLSLNYEVSIETSTFNKVVKNLTMLRKLDFSHVDMSLVVPTYFMNLSSSLSFLSLSYCRLSGKFPGGILQRPNLQLLDLGTNVNITGFLPPTSNWSDSLRYLYLSYTKIPIDFVSNFKSLEKLDVSGCNFVGSNLAFIGNLTQLNELYVSPNNFNGVEIPYSFGNLVKLTSLFLQSCNFSGQIPVSLGNLKRLFVLDFSENNLNGQIPSSLGNLKQLSVLDLSNNNLKGQIPFSLGNRQELSTLDLTYNNLIGQIPSSFGNLKQLSELELGMNNLDGNCPSSLGNLKKLTALSLNNNNLSGSIPNSFVRHIRLEKLDLSSNQLTGSIPSRLGRLSSLTHLDLSNNLLNETIPIFLFTLPSLSYLNLHNNQLTGEIVQLEHNSSLISFIDLSNNNLHGPIPIPSSISKPVYLLGLILSSNRNLTGEIPSSICMLSLQLLDLSNNSFNGPIPKCMENSSNGLAVLHLGMNYFNGTIPPKFLGGNPLKYVNFHNNEFEGQVPRSLINCVNLQFLDLSDNKIVDTFPFFLGSIPTLQVLVLRSNKLHGLLNNFSLDNSFPSLQIFDLSNNNLSGPLPYECFDHLEGMMMINSGPFVQYMGGQSNSGYSYDYSVELTIKGLEIELVKIQTILSSIDFSQNKFTGKIPKSIGKLKSLIYLNLSHNALGDNIQASLGNLTNLESLDLSSNFLIGRIPEQMLDLKFLQVFNVSYNQLEGPIPNGKQFNTFDSNSYQGNLGLCGFPLQIECNGGKTQQLNPSNEEYSESQNGFGWEPVVIGYGCGVLFGVIIGILVFKTRKRTWFVRMIEAEGYLWRKKFDKFNNARKSHRRRN